MINAYIIGLSVFGSVVLGVTSYSVGDSLQVGANLAFLVLYAGLFTLNVRRQRGIGKHATLLVLFVHMSCAVFLSEYAVPPVYCYVPSFFACMMMYHRPRVRYAVAFVHASFVILGWHSAARGTQEVDLLPWIDFAVVMAMLVVSAEFGIRTNRRYWLRDRTMGDELAALELSLRRQAEQVRAQTIELERTKAELAARDAENARRIDKLRALNEERASLASAASSDLKEPLRNMGSFVQLIGRRLDKLGLADDVREYLGFVTDGTTRMNTMVDDLLHYSDHQGERTATTVDTGVALAGIRAGLRDLLEREGATLGVADDLPTIKGQPTQITQLFQNLISNGIKFRRPGEAPHCEVGWAAVDGATEFFVRDNGIGIAPERLGDVFGLFTRLHERGSYEGTGIGLALCRRIVLAAGGDIWAESEGEGRGTTFRFTWPLALVDARAHLAEGART